MDLFLLLLHIPTVDVQLACSKNQLPCPSYSYSGIVVVRIPDAKCQGQKTIVIKNRKYEGIILCLIKFFLHLMTGYFFYLNIIIRLSVNEWN
jgi:hypothetical protein